jgi:hypothetical protein
MPRIQGMFSGKRGPVILLLLAAAPVRGFAGMTRWGHWRDADCSTARPRLALRLRGGAFGSARRASVGLSSAELSVVEDLRAALGPELKAAVKRNSDLGSDERLARLLRANNHDVPRTVKFWARMQQWRAELEMDSIRREVSWKAPMQLPPAHMLSMACCRRSECACF